MTCGLREVFRGGRVNCGLSAAWLLAFFKVLCLFEDARKWLRSAGLIVRHEVVVPRGLPVVAYVSLCLADEVLSSWLGSLLLGNSAGLSQRKALFIWQNWWTVLVFCNVQCVFPCLDTTVSLFLSLPILMYITYPEMGDRLEMKTENIL